jgi:hypothetical protein
MNITLIIYYSLLSIIIVTGIVRYKRLTIPYKILLLYIGVTLILEILSLICRYRYKNNLPVEHVASYSEFLLNSLVFYHLFRSKQTKKIIMVCIAAITVFFIFNSLKLQPYMSSFPSNSTIVSEIFYVILSLMIFKQMLQYPLQINITRQSIFWYNTAILFFSTTVFLNFALVNYYVKHHLNPTILYNCGLVLNMTFYLLIGVSIMIDDKNIIADNAG